MTRLSVVVASSGRDFLENTLTATRSQMQHGDELLVSIQTDCPWGHRARTQLQACARGDGLLYIDDDDVHVPGALDTARAALAADPDHPHLFRMRYADGRTLWAAREVREGNVSTQMVLVPNAPDLPRWGERYAGDYDFIREVCARAEPVWHEEIIALIRPN